MKITFSVITPSRRYSWARLKLQEKYKASVSINKLLGTKGKKFTQETLNHWFFYLSLSLLSGSRNFMLKKMLRQICLILNSLYVLSIILYTQVCDKYILKISKIYEISKYTQYSFWYLSATLNVYAFNCIHKNLHSRSTYHVRPS